MVWVQLPMWICMSVAIRNLTLMLPPSNDGNTKYLINNVNLLVVKLYKYDHIVQNIYYDLGFIAL